MTYSGETQDGDRCVFASISAAVNTLMGVQVWTQYSLQAEWQAANPHAGGPNFAHFPALIQAKVGNAIVAKQNCVANQTIPEYLQLIHQCLNDRGIAIVSLRTEDLSPQGVWEHKGWHMRSLLVRWSNKYVAFDTSPGEFHIVSEHELTSVISSTHRRLFLHEDHDTFLLTRS